MPREQRPDQGKTVKSKSSAVGTTAIEHTVAAPRRRDLQPSAPHPGKHETARTSSPVVATIERARAMGLMSASTQQVGARLPSSLLDHARRRTGITSTTDLLTFALASVSIDDGFATAFATARGKLDPDLDVGF